MLESYKWMGWVWDGMGMGWKSLRGVILRAPLCGAKNMKGGSVKSEILCVGQLARAEKKSRKERVSQNPPLGGKYLPNIYLTYIIRKYLKSVLSAIFNWSSNFIHILPANCLN